MSRLFGTITLLIASATSLLAAPLPRDPGKGIPHVVLQIKAINHWFEDYDHIHKHTKHLHKEFEDVNAAKLRDLLRGFFADWSKAIDLNKPIGMYLHIPEDFEKIRPVLMFPTNDEKAFVEMLKILFNDVSEEKDGVRSFTFSFIFSRIPSFVRFKHGHAYVTFTEPRELLDGAKLPDPRDVFIAEETAHLSLRWFVEGLSPEAKKQAKKLLELPEDQPLHRLGWHELLLMGLIGATDTRDFVHRFQRLVDEAKWFSLRLEFDRKTDEVMLEFNLVPQKDSMLSREIAAFKPRPSRFGAILDDDTAIGGVFSVGHFGGIKLDPQHFQEMVKDLLVELKLDGADLQIKPFASSILQSFKADGVDLGFALKRTKDGKSATLVGAAKVNKPKELETALLLYANFLPAEKRKRFQAAAVKLDGNLSAHRWSLPLPDDVEKVFGGSDVYFAFRDDGIYATLGADAVPRLKETLALKPKEAPSMLVQVNTQPALELLKRFDPDSRELPFFEKAFPKNTKVRLLDMSIESGGVLRVRYKADFLEIMKATIATLR